MELLNSDSSNLDTRTRKNKTKESKGTHLRQLFKYRQVSQFLVNYYLVITQSRLTY